MVQPLSYGLSTKLICAAVSIWSGTALLQAKAFLLYPAKIEVGTAFKNVRFGFNEQNFKNDAPKIKIVRVSSSKIRFVPHPQVFENSPSTFFSSGIQKSDGYAPDGIVLESSTHPDVEESELDTLNLGLVLIGKWDSQDLDSESLAIHNPIQNNVKQSNTQPDSSVSPTQTESRLALNDIPKTSQYGYSDLVRLLLKPATLESKTNRATQSVQGPKGPSAPIAITPTKNIEPEKVQAALNPSESSATQAVDNHQLLFSGQITEAFSAGSKAIAQANIQVLGTTLNITTDDNGNFSFENMTVAGVLPIIITKSGYLKRRIDLKPGYPATIELASENAVSSSAVAAGESYIPGTGYVFGQLVSLTNETSEAMKIDVQGPSSATILYLDASGIPTTKLNMTSNRGQFILLNMRPGTYHLTITSAFGQERAPHTIFVGESEGIVRKFSMGEQKFIRGQVINAAVNTNVADAVVKLLGSEKTALTDKKGQFVLGPVYADCNDINYLQMEKPGYYRNRVDYTCGNDSSSPIYVFPAAHTDGIALDAQMPLNASNGLVVGHVSFRKAVKMQLWGPEEMNADNQTRGKDFYYDSDGVLNGSRTHTSRLGNFAILDAPEGLSYMQSFSNDGKTLSYWPIYTAASTVNVYMQ